VRKCRSRLALHSSVPLAGDLARLPHSGALIVDFGRVAVDDGSAASKMCGLTRTAGKSCAGNLTRRLTDLEPIQEVRIHEQRDGLVKRRSMRRIMARRMKAATVRA
jgi:hypothetical protein